jgi:hypothetical protein
LGIVIPQSGFTLFVKMTGPAAQVLAAQDDFAKFCNSLKFKDPHAGHNHGGGMEGIPSMPGMQAATPDAQADVLESMARANSSGGFTWEAPAAWTQGEPRSMRLVTYTVGTSQCYITILGGMAGGAKANFDRWRSQLGQPALTHEEYTQLPKVQTLGEEAPYIVIRGEGEGDNMMLGMVSPQGEKTVFVKMIGPASELDKEIEHFKTFCSSIQHEGASR